MHTRTNKKQFDIMLHWRTPRHVKGPIIAWTHMQLKNSHKHGAFGHHMEDVNSQVAAQRWSFKLQHRDGAFGHHLEDVNSQVAAGHSRVCWKNEAWKEVMVHLTTMVHPSTHLGFCWHLVENLEDALVGTSSSGREEDGSGGACCSGGGWMEGKKSRRQRFREQGGPSRESLQRSHIVSVLRQIPALRFESCHVSSCRRPGREAAFLHHGRIEAEGNSTSRSEVQVSEEELPVDVMWPLSAVSELGVDEIFRVDWSAVPASADPLRGFGYKAPDSTKRKSLRGECRKQSHGFRGHGDENGEGEEDGLTRGARKRSQVESIATALKFLNLRAGSVVVDFGCGSGALSLPLACIFKELTFVCVDYKQESLRLLDLRAQAAKMINLITWQGRIEDYMEPFDACVALHACGHATDLALMQALRWRAGYVASPCCVGKIQFAVGSPSFTGIVYVDNYTPENLRTAIATKDGYIFPNLSNSGNVITHDQNGTHYSSTSIILKNSHQPEIQKYEVSADTLRNSSEEIVGSFSKTVTLKQDINEKSCDMVTHEEKAENLSGRVKGVPDHCLIYPRSRWLRSVITTNDFLLLARTADWSSYDYDSWTSRMHSLCKIMVELDRNLASQELGYCTSLFSLADQKAGAVGLNVPQARWVKELQLTLLNVHITFAMDKVGKSYLSSVDIEGWTLECLAGLG